MSRPIPKKAIQLIKSFESCRLTAYQDTGGVWTIGWGTTKGVHQGMMITQEEADRIFDEEIVKYAESVERNIKVRLNDDQFGALLSFHYNTGALSLPEAKCTLKRLVNARDYRCAADQFDRWIYDNGKRIKGLMRRREAERKMFLGED